MPELQGRLPIRVELEALTRDDMRRILTEPEASLIKQYVALMQTEGVTLDITPEAIDALADDGPLARCWWVLSPVSSDGLSCAAAPRLYRDIASC